jgi:hypothetical protein
MWRHVLLAASVLIIVGMSPALAQDVERFGDKLGEVPVDGATTDTIAGTGQVSATLSGNQLQVTGTFEGLLSPATAAHIHQGAPGIPGPVVLELSVNNATSGVVNGSFELTDEEVELLRAANFYVQIHSEQNPGGVIRGWLMPQ